MNAFKWLASAAKWLFSANNSFVPDVRVKMACEAIIAQTQSDIASLTDKLRAGQLTPAQYQQEMRRALDRNEIAQTALAQGGFDKLTPRILGRSSERLAARYEALNQFIRDVPTLTGQQVGNRAVYFAADGRATYENEVLQAQRNIGHEQAARILASGDNCPNCLEWASLGWIDAEEMQNSYPIGASVCCSRGFFCRCVIVTRLDADAPSAPAVEASRREAAEKYDAYQQLQRQKENLKAA